MIDVTTASEEENSEQGPLFSCSSIGGIGWLLGVVCCVLIPFCALWGFNSNMRQREKETRVFFFSDAS